MVPPHKPVRRLAVISAHRPMMRLPEVKLGSRQRPGFHSRAYASEEREETSLVVIGLCGGARY